MAFVNPFLSTAGQKERFKNVGEVINAAFNPLSKTKVKASIGGIAGKTLETIANHPYITAGVAATAISPKGAIAAAKLGAKAITKKVAALPTKTKVIGTIAAIPATSLLAKSPKARRAAKTIVTEGPSQLSALGSNIGTFIEDPSVSNLKNIITESPIALGVLGAVGVVAAAPLAASALSGALTRSELKKQTKAFERQAKAAESALGKTTAEQIPVAAEIGTSPVLAGSTNAMATPTKEIEQISRKPVAKRAKKRRKIYKEMPLKNTIRILNVNANRAG